MAKALIRLNPTDDSFALYLPFERRVKAFVAATSTPSDAFCYELRQRWLLTPNLTGYFLWLDDGVPRFHSAAWINSTYGRNVLFIYQAEADRKFRPNFTLWWAEQLRWIEDFNAKVPFESQKVQTAEFQSSHSVELYERYFRLKGLKTSSPIHHFELPLQQAKGSAII